MDKLPSDIREAKDQMDEQIDVWTKEHGKCDCRYKEFVKDMP